MILALSENTLSTVRKTNVPPTNFCRGLFYAIFRLFSIMRKTKKLLNKSKNTPTQIRFIIVNAFQGNKKWFFFSSHHYRFAHKLKNKNR